MGANFCGGGRETPLPITLKLDIKYKQNLEHLQSCVSIQFYILDLLSTQNKNLIDEIAQQRQAVKRFTSIKDLKQFKDDHQNNVLLVCDQSHYYLQNLLPNSKAFQRIAFTHHKDIQELQNAEKVLKKINGYRFAGLFPFQQQPILHFLETKDISQSIYFCNNDYGLINRALSNIYFFLDRQAQHQYHIFHQYLKAQGAEGKALELEIHQLIHDKVKLGEFTAKKVAEQNKILINAINLFKLTSYPGIIAHVSWFYDVLHTFTRKSYYSMLPNLQLTQVYIVVELNPEEISSITPNSNFMFSTFVVGYTILADAQRAKDKSPKSFIFMVNLPKNMLNKNLPRQDFGFCVVGDRVIFTLQTLFKIDKFKKLEREIHVTYGVLGRELNLRRQEFRYLNIAKLPNLNMLKYFDYLAYCKFYIKNQADLLLHLEYYNKYKSLPRSEVSTTNSLLNQTESTIPLPSAINASNTSSLSTSSEFRPTLITIDEKTADVQSYLGNLQLAENYYNIMAPLDRGMMKKLYMFDRSNKAEEFKQTIQKLREIQVGEAEDNKFQQIALMSYNAVMMAEKKRQKEAEKKIEESLKRINDEYKAKFVKKQNLHEVSISSFPLYSILLRNGAKAARKLGHTSLAEMHESDYNHNWPFFDGTHLYWLP